MPDPVAEIHSLEDEPGTVYVFALPGSTQDACEHMHNYLDERFDAATPVVIGASVTTEADGSIVELNRDELLDALDLDPEEVTADG